MTTFVKAPRRTLDNPYKSPRAKKPGITKSEAYSCGVFTIATDLRAIVELCGPDFTHKLVDVMEAQLNQHRNASRRVKASTRIVKTDIQKKVSKQLGDAVRANLEAMLKAHQETANKRNRRVAA